MGPFTIRHLTLTKETAHNSMPVPQWGTMLIKTLQLMGSLEISGPGCEYMYMYM